LCVLCDRLLKLNLFRAGVFTVTTVKSKLIVKIVGNFEKFYNIATKIIFIAMFLFIKNPAAEESPDEVTLDKDDNLPKISYQVVNSIPLVKYGGKLKEGATFKQKLLFFLMTKTYALVAKLLVNGVKSAGILLVTYTLFRQGLLLDTLSYLWILGIQWPYFNYIGLINFLRYPTMCEWYRDLGRRYF